MNKVIFNTIPKKPGLLFTFRNVSKYYWTLEQVYKNYFKDDYKELEPYSFKVGFYTTCFYKNYFKILNMCDVNEVLYYASQYTDEKRYKYILKRYIKNPKVDIRDIIQIYLEDKGNS